MNKAAVRNERLLGADAKKCETAQAKTARLLADEIVVVPAVPHPHGIQPCVHAAAEFDVARASPDSLSLQVEKDHSCDRPVRKPDQFGRAGSPAFQEQLYVPALTFPDSFSCRTMR